jgi:carboxypeptidase PM20D1
VLPASRGRRAVLLLVVVALAGLAVTLVRALRLRSRQLPATAAALVGVDEAAAAARLRGALQMDTVSPQGGTADAASLARLHEHLRVSFPRLHAELEREVVGGSLLYTWRGTDVAAAPVVLTGHLDVVPIEPGQRWTHPPFAGVVEGGFVWGRGALDDKGAVLAACEAVEALLGVGFAPRRTVHLAFGHDEEVGGRQGAARLAAILAERGTRAHLVLDEGLVVVDGLVPGVASPVALVGVAEKGVLTLELAVEIPGGHSSMPARHSAVGVLAAALARLEATPLPARLEGVGRQTFAHLAPEMPLGPRVAFANLWLFGPLVRRQLEASASTAALLRTTTALTVVQAGVKENVIPQAARALVNFRLLPGDRAADVTAGVQRIVADERVRVRALEPPDEASAVAPDDGPAWRAIAQAVRDAMPGTVVAPGLVLGQTDGRHYERLGGPVYRFAPYRLGPADLARLHGVDERVGAADHVRAAQFYARLLQTAQEP